MDSQMYSFDRKQSRSGRFWIKGLIRKFERSCSTSSFGGPIEETENEPLYLSKYIENGNIEEGKEAARVTPFCGNVRSYSGFLTVDREKESHMFFWFFPSEREDKDTPLLVWLNGWGTPSTYGVLFQNGPYVLDENGLSLRDISWHKWYNVLYVDNPLGVGYSHCPEAKYSTSMKSIATNLYWALHQFLKLFPELKSKDLYLTGKSMAGKYITHFVKEIEMANLVHKKKIKLKGIFLGNPLLAGAYQMRYSKYLYQLGFIDQNEKEIFETLEDGIMQLVTEGKYDEAIKSCQGYVFSTNSYIKDLTGLKDLYDVRHWDLTSLDSIRMKSLSDFLKLDNVRRNLHVGTVCLGEEIKPLFLLKTEIPKSSITEFESLLQTHRILWYCGQFDVICNYPALSAIMSKMNWPGKEQFNRSTRIRLEDDTRVYGYMKTYGNLTEVLVRNAGHSVAEDQPQVTLDLLHSFIQFYDLKNLPP